MRLSYTSTGTFLTCPQKFYYQNILRYEPVEKAGPLMFGTVIHEALEKFYKGGEMELPEANTYEAVAAAAVLRGYEAFWGRPKSVILVEFAMEVDIGGVPMVVKADAIVNTPDGPMVVEHKTASMIGDQYWKKKEHDIQPSLYILGARQHGISVLGCIYDVIRKPAPPKAKEKIPDYAVRITEDIAARPEFYYERRSFYKTEADLEKVETNMALVANAIQRAEDTGEYPKNHNACFDFNRECSWAPVCHGNEIIPMSNLYRKREES